jgi:hypothetical protein
MRAAAQLLAIVLFAGAKCIDLLALLCVFAANSMPED